MKPNGERQAFGPFILVEVIARASKNHLRQKWFEETRKQNVWNVTNILKFSPISNLDIQNI